MFQSACLSHSGLQFGGSNIFSALSEAIPPTPTEAPLINLNRPAVAPPPTQSLLCIIPWVVLVGLLDPKRPLPPLGGGAEIRSGSHARGPGLPKLSFFFLDEKGKKRAEVTPEPKKLEVQGGEVLRKTGEANSGEMGG